MPREGDPNEERAAAAALGFEETLCQADAEVERGGDTEPAVETLEGSVTEAVAPTMPQMPAAPDDAFADALRRQSVEAALFGEASAPPRMGRFEVQEALGAGGMGVVYRGFDPLTGASVALKTMRRGAGDVSRFSREIALLAALEHPRIVRYVEHGALADGSLYLAMELLEGEELRVHLERVRPQIRGCVAMAIAVAEGLAAVHSLGVVHRDIKPGNIFLVEGAIEAVKLLDLGIARAGALMPVTRAGMLVGTLGYMAPEQALGDAAIDARADLFSLGCVLYEALAGRVPFAGEHPVAILTKIALEDPSPLSELRPELPAGLVAVVEAMLAKSPSERPRSAQAVIEALRGCFVATPARADVSAPVSYRERQALCLLVIAGAEATRWTDLTQEGSSDEDGPADATIERAAARYGGSLTRLIDGSLVLAFWADGSLREAGGAAARCALELRRARPELRQALAIGRAERSGDAVIGRVIDGAALLLAGGAVGAIVVDEAVSRALDGGFVVQVEGAQRRLLSVRQADAEDERLLGRASPFVGRARELGWLRGIYRDCVEERRWSGAIVIAPPGQGKTRLCRELVRELAATEAEAPGVFELRCWAGSSDASLAALRGGLRRLVGVEAETPAEAALARVQARFRAISGERAGLHVGVIAQLCGVPPPPAIAPTLAALHRDPRAMGDALRLTWLEILRVMAAERPLLLVIDDLQWCDGSTASLVEAAAAALLDEPVMLLASARPELDARRPAPWPCAAVERRALASLSVQASEGMIRRLLGARGVDEALVRSLVAQAEGNPLFLEELLRAYERGEEGAPEGVLAVVQGRLRRLDEEARRLLRAASVFDGAFSAEGVARLLGRSLAEVQAGLGGLVAMELVVATASASGGAQALHFRHALVREAAYATLAEADQRAAHAAAAAWLASRGDAAPAELAAHYARGELRGPAKERYLEAARQALGCADPLAAAAHVAKADALVSAAPTVEHHLVAAEVALWRGELAEAEARAAAAQAGIELGEARWWRALYGRIACAELRADLEALRGFVRAMDAAIAAQEEAPIHEYTLPSVASAAYALSVMGAQEEARALLRSRVSPLEEARASPLVRAQLLRARSVLAVSDADLWGGLEFAARAIDDFEAGGDLRGASRMRLSYGYGLINIGAADRGAPVLAAAADAGLRIGADDLCVFAEIAGCYLMLAQGREAEAEARLAGLQLRVSAEMRRVTGFLLVGRARAAAPGSEAAVTRAEQALAFCGQGSPLGLVATAALARALAARGAVEEAAAAARRGVAGLAQVVFIIDDVFWVWARLIEALAAVGLAGEAEAAASLAEARVRRLEARLPEALRAGLERYEPVVMIRAHGRAQAPGPRQ